MIVFIEKEPFYDNSPFSGQCHMYPTYMVKDGEEYFVFNRRDPDNSWALDENEQRKKHLLSTGGAYFKFNGYYNDPLEMLARVIERKHHFTQPESMYYCEDMERGYADFHGNRREVSAAFHYRIYDVALHEKIRRVVNLINKEAWEDAEAERVR